MQDLPVPEPFMTRIDDAAVLTALDAVCSPQSYNMVLYGALCAVCRAYEKGAKVEPFMELLEDFMKLTDLMARMRFLYATKHLIEKAPLQVEHLDTSIKWITTEAENTRERIIKQMLNVKKIPAKGVRKH